MAAFGGDAVGAGAPAFGHHGGLSVQQFGGGMVGEGMSTQGCPTRTATVSE